MRRLQHISEVRYPAGCLHEKYDSIVIPDQAANSFENGHRSSTMPPEYVGGQGPTGAESLKQFAEAGGTLIFLNGQRSMLSRGSV
jgi:hypothetical protein